MHVYIIVHNSNTKQKAQNSSDISSLQTLQVEPPPSTLLGQNNTPTRSTSHGKPCVGVQVDKQTNIKEFA